MKQWYSVHLWRFIRGVCLVHVRLQWRKFALLSVLVIMTFVCLFLFRHWWRRFGQQVTAVLIVVNFFFFFFAAVQIPTRVRGCVSVSLWMNSLDYSSFIVCSFLHSFLVFLSGSTFHLFDEMLYLCQVLKYTCNSFLSFHTSRLLIYFHWLSKKILQFSLFFCLPTSKQVF